MNPITDGAPSLGRLGCWRVIICMAEDHRVEREGRITRLEQNYMIFTSLISLESNFMGYEVYLYVY